MPRRTRPDDRDRPTDAKFYLPAGASITSIADRFERIWSTLFNHHVGPRK